MIFEELRLYYLKMSNIDNFNNKSQSLQHFNESVEINQHKIDDQTHSLTNDISACPVFSSLNKLTEEKRTEMLRLYEGMVQSGEHSNLSQN